jgi:hypothetical protein
MFCNYNLILVIVSYPILIIQILFLQCTIYRTQLRTVWFGIRCYFMSTFSLRCLLLLAETCREVVMYRLTNKKEAVRKNEYIFTSEMSFVCVSVNRVDHGYSVVKGTEYSMSLLASVAISPVYGVSEKKI